MRFHLCLKWPSPNLCMANSCLKYSSQLVFSTAKPSLITQSKVATQFYNITFILILLFIALITSDSLLIYWVYFLSLKFILHENRGLVLFSVIFAFTHLFSQYLLVLAHLLYAGTVLDAGDRVLLIVPAPW